LLINQLTFSMQYATKNHYNACSNIKFKNKTKKYNSISHLGVLQVVVFKNPKFSGFHGADDGRCWIFNLYSKHITYYIFFDLYHTVLYNTAYEIKTDNKIRIQQNWQTMANTILASATELDSNLTVTSSRIVRRCCRMDRKNGSQTVFNVELYSRSKHWRGSLNHSPLSKQFGIKTLQMQLSVIRSLISRVRTIPRKAPNIQYPIILASSNTNTQYQCRYLCIA